MAARPQDPTRAFLGVGWAFPPRLALDGTVAEVAYEDDVREAILIILQTNPGERLMRPEFGAGLKDFVFEPVHPTTLARIRTRVESALVAFEPRIVVEQVAVTSDAAERNKVLVAITYRVRSTNVVQNLVYPF